MPPILSGAVSLALALLGPPTSLAQATTEHAGVEVEWDAPDPCPTQTTLRAHVESHLDVSLDSIGERVTAIARVRPEGEAWSLKIWTVMPEGTRSREIRHAKCEALEEAAAMLIAVAVDPRVLGSVKVSDEQLALVGDLSPLVPDACTPGQSRCTCEAGFTCRSGLSCLSNLCVDTTTHDQKVALEQIRALDSTENWRQRDKSRLLGEAQRDRVRGAVLTAVGVFVAAGGATTIAVARGAEMPGISAFGGTTLGLGLAGTTAGISLLAIGSRKRKDARAIHVGVP